MATPTVHLLHNYIHFTIPLTKLFPNSLLLQGIPWQDSKVKLLYYITGTINVQALIAKTGNNVQVLFNPFAVIKKNQLIYTFGVSVLNSPYQAIHAVKYLATIYCQRDNIILHLVIFFSCFFEGWKLFTLLEKKYKCQCMHIDHFFLLFLLCLYVFSYLASVWMKSLH